MCVSAVSYNSNSDGDGLSVDGEILAKSENKVNLMPYREIIEGGKTFLSHQRWSTSGLSEAYTQPFAKSEFILLHNGVLNGLSSEHSDTYNLFVLFKKAFVEVSKWESVRKKAIVKTIKRVFKEVSGSFSIALYDKMERKTYYFKNDRTNIHGWVNTSKDVLYLTTESDNGKFLTIFNDEWKEVDITDLKIYCISENERIKIVGTIKEKEFGYSFDTNKKSKKSDFNNINSVPTEEFPEETYTHPEGLSKKKLKRMVRNGDKLPEFIEMFQEKPCAYCGFNTNIIGRDYKMNHICKLCLDEDSEVFGFTRADNYKAKKEHEAREMEEWEKELEEYEGDGYDKNYYTRKAVNRYCQ